MCSVVRGEDGAGVLILAPKNEEDGEVRPFGGGEGGGGVIACVSE